MSTEKIAEIESILNQMIEIYSNIKRVQRGAPMSSEVSKANRICLKLINPHQKAGTFSKSKHLNDIFLGLVDIATTKEIGTGPVFYICILMILGEAGYLNRCLMLEKANFKFGSFTERIHNMRDNSRHAQELSTVMEKLLL